MINKISKEDIIYLAGLIDGDGSVIAQFIKHKDYRSNNPWEIRTLIQITQKSTRLYFLEDILKIVGAGRAGKRKDSDVADFILQEPLNLIEFLTMLKPYLRLKRKQAELLIEIIQKREIYQNKTKKEKEQIESVMEFIAICPLVDQVSNLNDSKSRTNTAAKVIKDLKERNSL